VNILKRETLLFGPKLGANFVVVILRSRDQV